MAQSPEKDPDEPNSQHRGDVDAACAYLETYRPRARNTEKLEELLTYLGT